MIAATSSATRFPRCRRAPVCSIDRPLGPEPVIFGNPAISIANRSRSPASPCRAVIACSGMAASSRRSPALISPLSPRRLAVSPAPAAARQPSSHAPPVSAPHVPSVPPPLASRRRSHAKSVCPQPTPLASSYMSDLNQHTYALLMIMAGSAGGGGRPVAGIITIAKGHDASYPWKQIGAAEPAEPGKPGKPAKNAGKGVGYYLSPAEKGGEPPGIWTGKAGAEFGLQPGATVERQVFERLYGQHLDPRDPSGQTRLGRAPGHYKTAETIHAAMLAAEPEATAERRAELLIEAKAQVRTPDLYWDATFSVSKSISLFHASALANAAAAAQRGDLESVQAWEDVADGIWDAIMEGNAAALDYLQREAGQTRAGYHPGGRWEDARAWVIASFRQHTSRDGDPQLHVHNLILHKVRRESDGEWRALDSMSLYRHRPAASAIAALAAENALTRDFGVRWIPRADGHGREIAGVGEALMDMFSSRRRSIGPLTARLAQAFEAQFGRAPDARALASLRQWANHATRRGKDAGALDLAALVRQWSAHARASEAGALEPVAPAVMGTSARAPLSSAGTKASRRKRTSRR